MFIIDYNNVSKYFTVFLDFKQLNYSDSQDIIQFFKSQYLQYLPTSKSWKLQTKNYQEFIFLANRKKYDYCFSVGAESFLKASSFFKKETKFFRGEKFDPSVLKVKPYDFQVEAVNWQISRSRVYSAFDAGTGKSLMSIATFLHWFEKGKIDGVFIIVQNGLGYHWKREMLNSTYMFNEKDIVIINNENKRNPFEVNLDKRILICPNHLVADLFASYRPNVKGRAKKGMHWNKSFVNVKTVWGKENICLVSDEHHGFKNSSSLKSKALCAHLDHFDFRIFLSATPAINSFQDWFHQINMLDPGILQMSEKAASIYVAKVLGNRFNPNAIVEYDTSKVEEIKAKFSFNVIRKSKDEIPEMKTIRVIEPIFLELTSLQKELYKAVYDMYFLRKEEEQEKISYREILVKFPYALQVLDNPCLLKEKLVGSKIETLLKQWSFDKDPRLVWLDEFLKYKINELEEKVVIYDVHPLTLDLLKERYEKYSPLMIHGKEKTNEEERQQIQDKFNDKTNDHKLILLSFSTSSTGINLQYGSSTVVIFTLPSDITLFRQSIDRTARINSVKDSLVKICVLDESFDNIRYQRAIARTELNDSFLTKEFSQEELRKLLQGSF